jgi:hypothetical protein
LIFWGFAATFPVSKSNFELRNSELANQTIILSLLSSKEQNKEIKEKQNNGEVPSRRTSTILLHYLHHDSSQPQQQ